MNRSTVPAERPSDTPTTPVTSRSRQQGTEWAEALFRQASPATDDVQRFARALLCSGRAVGAPKRLVADLALVALGAAEPRS
jgi:hypothetical protein